MKDYNEVAQDILRRRDEYVVSRRRQIKRLAATASCFCLIALVGFGAWRSGISNAEVSRKDTVTEEKYGSVLSEASQGVEQTQSALPSQEHSATEGAVYDYTTAKQEDSPAVSDKQVVAESAPLAPEVMYLTEKELYDDIGALLPDQAPAGFAFESASVGDYGYCVIWYHGLEELTWRIRDYTDQDAGRITDVADTINYDLALYPIPRAESVPDELREIVDNPIFRGQELSLEVVYARVYKVADVGDSSGYRMHFSVLFGDKVVTITSKGVSPDWLYGQLSGLSV